MTQKWWHLTRALDGDRIAYGSGGVIFILPVDGGEPVRLPNPQIRVTKELATWSPDGTSIAFQLSHWETGPALADPTGAP